jgi:branched-chain amino acid transport system permease protein
LERVLLLAQLIVNGVYIGSVYAMLGLSFATIFATTKTWHFAQGAVYSIAAYAILELGLMPGLPLVVVVLGAAAVAAAAGILCQLALYRPLRARQASPLVVVMGSLGLMVVIENLLALVFGPSGFSLALELPPPLLVAGVVVSPAQLWAPLVALAVTLVFLAFLSRTVLGQQFRALVVDEELLRLNGVETERLKLWAFAIGSAMLAVPAALLMASGAGVSPYIGIPAVLTGAMALFLGGVDSFAGAALGGLAIGVVENVSVWLIPTEWQTAITYALLLLFLMLRPTGLMGRRLRQSAV